MKSLSLKLFVLILLNYLCEMVHCFEEESLDHLNNRPIVGILFQEYKDNQSQYLANAYVKSMEAGGARVVPIFINQNKRYYHYLMNRLNGVVLTGGDVSLLDSIYAKTADLLLEITIAKNDRGIHFPMWATCQGFEKLITYYMGNRDTNWITMCKCRNVALKLDFTPGLDLFKETQMFHYGHEIVPILAKYPVTPNYHSFCLTPKDFNRNANLTSNFILISTNTHAGTHFVSTIEHRKYPIYGSQWHPEKAQFNWVYNNHSGHINHDYRAGLVGQYFSNFFVNQTRKNHQHYRKTREERESLIVNYHNYLEYTGLDEDAYFQEIYKLPL